MVIDLQRRPRVAVVGSGISGLIAARELHDACDLTVFEASGHIGGHSRTVDVDSEVGPIPVDTGFIVFNRRTYPHFTGLLEQLGVEPQDSDMSFSMSHLGNGLEYRASSLDTLFAQRRNLLRPSFMRMARQILRFNRLAPLAMDEKLAATTLGEFLDLHRFGATFRRDYLQPMGAAIWSTSPARLLDFPVRFFVEFFANHGLLTVSDQPQWLTIPGGSRTYVEALIAPFRSRIRTRTPISRVVRRGSEVVLRTAHDTLGSFDEVVLAVHADQALGMLAGPTEAERVILGALPYSRNDAVLHSDESFLPRNRRAWASWNYRYDPRRAERATVTYDLTRLQTLPGSRRMLLTLNPAEHETPRAVHGTFSYSHPTFVLGSHRAQQRWGEISGHGGLHYCGAYWGYGFHEDGARSGLRAARAILERAAA